MTTRREFFVRAATGSATLLVAIRAAHAQQGGDRGMVHTDTMVMRDSQNLFAMDQSAAVSVKLPPKPNAKPQLTDLQRDELERHIHCQCGCTLDVFTCRTTDFSCQVSPAMHHDVMGLVKGGYGAQEIIDAFVGAYGQRVLMEPKKSGFNLLAWLLPGTMVVVAAGAIGLMLRRWRPSGEKPIPLRPKPLDVDATTDELRRLDAAVKGDDDA